MEPELRGIPPELLAAVREVIHVSRGLLAETGREPFLAEVAQRTGKPLDEVKRLLAIAKSE